MHIGLHAIDPATGHCALLTDDQRLQTIMGVEVVDTERCAYVTERVDGCIYRTTLPPRFFERQFSLCL